MDDPVLDVLRKKYESEITLAEENIKTYRNGFVKIPDPRAYDNDVGFRVECPSCGEKIRPHHKCQFCVIDKQVSKLNNATDKLSTLEDIY